ICPVFDPLHYGSSIIRPLRLNPFMHSPPFKMPQFSPSDTSQTGLLLRIAPSEMSEKNRSSSKEHLHDWSIYRQNVTSSMADLILSNASSSSYTPYGDFRLRDDTVKEVLKKSRPGSPLQNRNDFLRYGLPRVDPIDFHYSTAKRPEKRPIKDPALQYRSMPRKASSAWDLRPSPVNRQLTLNGGHYAESDLVPDRSTQNKGGFFTSSRHHSHYFSNTDLFGSGGFNYLRYAKASELQLMETTHPHLLIQNLSFSHDLRSTTDCIMLRLPKYLHTIGDFSLELFGGDTLALMYTSELEMRTLLRVLTQHSPPPGNVSGRLSINGHRLRLPQMAARIAHVPIEDPSDVLTVEQHLRCSADFKRPATESNKTGDMIEQLIRSLALGPFKNRLVKNLGKTEKQRLKIAMALLKDTDILIVDNITRDMDIYDVAFLVDFLRDWALRLGRIVIVSIAPTTVEILTMFHKAAIFASGRLVYCGASNEMVDYFESIGYPCPPFKNPCDYYVDLVTCDHLTPDASAESLERIKKVADAWARRSGAFQPRPLPVATVSPMIRDASIPGTSVAILKQLLYVAYNNPSFVLLEPFVALLISTIIGFAFYQMPVDSRRAINDRFGLIECLLFLGTFLLLMTSIARCHFERRFLHADLRSGNYGVVSYFITRQLFDLPILIITTLCFSIPAGFLSSLYSRSLSTIGALATLTGILFIHLIIWRLIAVAASHTLRKSSAAVSFLGLFLLLCTSLSGVPITSLDQSETTVLISLLSPSQWIGRLLLQQEFMPGRAVTNLLPFSSLHSNITEMLFGCERHLLLAKKIITEVPIFTLSECAKLPGSSLLFTHGIDPGFLLTSPTLTSPPQPTIYLKIGSIVLSSWFIASALAACSSLKMNHRPKMQSKTSVYE
ncbi:abcx-1, partial [Pristionchus pacificus]|uniref:ABC transporter domain-containing protein n=1 Tax=Pristionchus pacificus TaxID=54126 RepID=A0A8R1V2M0_PRIPA